MAGFSRNISQGFKISVAFRGASRSMGKSDQLSVAQVLSNFAPNSRNSLIHSKEGGLPFEFVIII